MSWLAFLMKHVFLHVVSHIAMLDNPNKAWSRVFGARRSKTLRNRFRAWIKVRSWLVAYNGQVWPKSVSDMVNFMEDSIDDFTGEGDAGGIDGSGTGGESAGGESDLS